jgi:hypothetical protein
MNSDEAVKRLRDQANSFLHLLRPYRGLRDQVLNDVMDALRACSSRLREEPLSRELVSALWAISRLGRSWALNPGGMLRRNHLIAAADLTKLWDFLEEFDYAVMALLDGADPVWPRRRRSRPRR